MNIYLDIDGVLINKNGQPANYVGEFLEYLANNHDVYWLTTHCQGDSLQVERYLADKLPKECLQFLNKIRPTSWTTLKTEAIDYTKDFMWFDDYIMQSEINILEKNNALASFVQIDLRNKPDKLKSFIDKL